MSRKAMSGGLTLEACALVLASAAGGPAPAQPAPKYAAVPIWVFHGAEDDVEPVKSSRDLVAALKEAGGSPRYHEFPGAGHDVWEQVYRDPRLYAWLFAQKRD
jgi:predicted peptidase